MPRFSSRLVVLVVFFIISTRVFNVDSFLREFFGEEEVDQTDPAALLRQHGLLLVEYEPYGAGEANIPPSEMSALHDLYDALNGDEWAWGSNPYSGIPWNFSATANPCADKWHGISCTLSFFNGTEHLNVEGIKLSEINLQGTIPVTIGNLTQLRILNFLTNAISGSIPETIYSLSLLTFLDLGANVMNGTISNDIARCTEMSVLTLNNNNFTGPLPERLSELTGLKQLTINNNEIIGTIPSSYGNLVQLTILNIGTNFLVGTVPASLGQLTQLTQLSVNNNYFDGTLPESFASLTALNAIYLDFNGFYGPIPDYISTYSALIYLVMNENYFSGPIPAWLAQLTQCTHLYMHNNALTGTIPSELGTMTQLTLVDFHANKITGSIPPELGSLFNLGVLDLYTNLLTGTVPAELGGLALIQNLDFSQNYITGSIPDSIGNLTTCLTLKMHETQLSGKIPATFGNLASVLYLSFHSNHHTGTIPSSISHLPYLNSIFMYSNMFTGNIAYFINPAKQLELAIVQLSSNQFTGQIPDSLFALPKLQTVALVSNCFSGSIPPVICTSVTLKTLSLDGLRSASSCQKLIIPGVFKSYTLKGNIKSGIPSCLFEMPTLNTLHLSGNGLTGTLPQNLSLSPNLIDLSLSHNSLKGDIPSAFQRRVWFNLDLSYNKLGGTLTANFATIIGNLTVMKDVGLEVVNASTNEYAMPIAALSLRNNRLSDVIPRNVVQMENVSVLDGNLFSCNMYQTNLPQNDDGKNTYECGSSSLNTSGYIYAGLIGTISVVLLLAFVCKEKSRRVLQNHVQGWRTLLTIHSDHFSSQMSHYLQFCIVMSTLLRAASYCVCFIICIVLPVYLVLSSYYGTHTFEYAWVASGAYLSGTTPFAVTLILMLGVECIFLYQYYSLCSTDLKVVGVECEVVKFVLKKRVETFIVCCLFVCINVTIVSAANVAYVYVVLYGEHTYLVVAQIAMSVFKLVWGNVGSVYVMRFCKQLLITATSISDSDVRTDSDELFALQLFVALFNTIVVPIVVVALVNPSCFSGVLVAAAPVSAFYYYEECTLFTVMYGCQEYHPRIGGTSYRPPFTYGFQCSSNLVSYYAPTFMYMGFVAAFVNPALSVCQRYMYVRSKHGPYEEYVLKVVPLILQDVENLANKNRSVHRVFLNANDELVVLCTFLCIILTFGVLFPPIALCMLIAMFSVVYATKTKVGLLLSAALKVGEDYYAGAIDSNCFGVGTIDKLDPCVKQLVFISVLFYSFFLFDTLGDDIGAKKTLWVFLIVPVLLLILILFNYLYTAMGVSKRMAGDTSVDDNGVRIEGVEMQAVHTQPPARTDDSVEVVSALHVDL